MLEFRPTMKGIILCMALFWSLCVFAAPRNRNWQDAVLADIKSTTDNNGVAVMPIGSMVYGVPIRRVDTYLGVDTADMK